MPQNILVSWKGVYLGHQNSTCHPLPSLGLKNTQLTDKIREVALWNKTKKMCFDLPDTSWNL